ncbi:MAG: site-specific DNA-methyltransferase [Firmicutes bacterium]|nr:site-specific DNA-methyltransferase [Bacillota bacterium]
MSLIFSLPAILEESRREYKKIKENEEQGKDFYPVEQLCHNEPEHGAAAESILAKGDNLEFIQYLMREKDIEGRIQLIYMDPPFYSKASYDAVIKLKSPLVPQAPAIKPAAYEDVWKTGIEDYLRMLCVRFFLVKDLLSEEGCFWVHLDWHVVHYVKILLDEIFGEKNFINEVVWNYKSGGTGKRNFSRKHDTLLFYSKTKNYYFQPLKEKSYNRGYKPYRFKGVNEYKDEMGWYTMVNMKDVWQIDMVGRTSSERTGYATQKPEQLLSRIIESCSRKGELCADFFGGSGTLAAAAEQLGRRWISCDIGDLATASCLKRMSVKKSSFTLMGDRFDREGEALLLDVEVEPIEFTAKKLVTVTLQGYEPDEKSIPVKGEEREVIKAFCRADSLQLLEYWSVDFHYDGNMHSPEFSFPKEKDSIEKTCSQIGQSISRISIRAVDVFGNSMLKVLELDQPGMASDC